MAVEHDGLLQGFTVDGGTSGAVASGPVADLLDHEGHARRAYGVTDPALVLVRPDNHLALLTRDPAEVTAYLTRIATFTPEE
ncbi:hypothetical protein [Streptomyces sp. STR69]|uniref:hypothetical protein n=1 Tax=Streptomyces sp. STR69 TaxID=1796942 RepID=UPI0021C87BA9|nr:hypothetical protein [Streptomyces sp. STR69]